MKYYLLGLATLVAVCVGCQSTGRDLSAMRGGPASPSDEVVVARGNHGRGSGHHRPYVAPPAEMLVRPGPMVDGPGPGVLNGIGMGANAGTFGGTTQVKFLEPVDMQIGWQIEGGFADAQLSAPGRYNFAQAATYRLKLSNVTGVGREGMVLYPTLQVYPAHPQTDAFLAHNAVPVQITEEDLDQVQANNFVTKVIYLPNAAHQELAVANIEQLVSTRLDPGLDPVAEADRRGTILLVLRIGNMDLETPDGAFTQGGITQASHVQTVSGEAGQFAPPMPIGVVGAPGMSGGNIPPAMMVSGPVYPGQPAGLQPWGMPITGTPIGLAGPPHLPYGAPAGLRSHTVRNLSKNHIPEPTRDLLIDVKQSPPINMPEPVRHIEYEERHPVFHNH
jgi:hypothetical protein